MDILTGLTAASQAIGLVKQLRDLDKALDEAAFKAKLLEVQEAVFDAKSALLEAKQDILERNDRIAALEQRLKAATTGELCPICGSGSLKVVSVTPHPTLGAVGMQEHTLRCDNGDCGHVEKRMNDPNRRIIK